MNSIILPESVNYATPLPTLPEGTQQINVAASPINGSSFKSGDQIMFDFLNRGFLVPDSIYICYTWTATLTTPGSNVPKMFGCPVYTSFNRLDLQIGSQTVDSIQNYNVVMHMLSNLTMNVAEKYGMQSSFGYLDYDGDADLPGLEDFDGRTILASNLTGSFSGPLMSLITNSEKLIPLFGLPQMRIVLSIESLAGMFKSTQGSSVDVLPATWTLSNVELRYKIVDMGGNVENIVRDMGEKIYIKSQSFGSSSATLNSGTMGSTELIFNQRYASVKSVFAINGVNSDTSNSKYDSVDLTSNNGEYSFLIGGIQYPQKPLNTKYNKTGILQELRAAVGSIYDKNNSFSINTVEFNYISTDTTNTVQRPAKCYIGVSTEKINSNSLLTGISTQNSPISYRISSGTSIGTKNAIITLVVNYDALIEIDLVNRQCSVKT